MGVQILDQTGRVNAILPVSGGRVSAIGFGGKDFDILYIQSQNKTYRRKLKTRGASPAEAPNKPDAPKL